MAQVVNTNVHSLTAQRNLNATQSSMATSLQRLSSGLRGTLGVIQNRFGSTIANLSTQSENLSAARSRIQDADFTAETANLTRARIPQQAGTPGFRSECHDFRNQ